ncbi:esterase/lipase [Geopyxis carbonaria]|nr:esterase/lipase [Geopyxis carbonaria]
MHLITTLLTGLGALAGLASAAAFTEVTGFGTNPSNAKMYIYVPDKLAAKPAVVVGIHWCHGTATDYYRGTNLASRADSLGFIVIYPSASTSDGCWDVSSAATLKHLGGGDSLAIHSMVQYTLSKYSADASRVFAIGTSSGAMMTNVLLGAYPDVFAAGSAWAGVPFGCFAGSNTWNSDCASGLINKTPAQWGDLVRAAYAGYSGRRPKMQLFHGTSDETLNFNNFGEEIEQWTNVLGVSASPSSTESGVPQSGWTRTRYGGGVVEAVREEGQTHNLVVLPDEGLRFFGLM